MRNLKQRPRAEVVRAGGCSDSRELVTPEWPQCSTSPSRSPIEENSFAPSSEILSFSFFLVLQWRSPRCFRPTPRSAETPLTQPTPALVVLHPCGAHYHRHGWWAPPRAPRPRYASTTCAMGGGGTRVHRVPRKVRVYVMRARANSLSLGRRAFFTMAIVPSSGWATPSCPKEERENRQNAECSKIWGFTSPRQAHRRITGAMA